MIFIGERINTGFKDIKQAVMDKDPKPLQEWAKKQTEAGADYLDVNLGAVSADPADMCWMVETVQGAVETPISIDTNKPAILAEAIKVCNKPPLVNSSTAAPEKMDAFLPIVVEHNASIIGLSMDESGAPKSADARVEKAGMFMATAMEHGITPDRIFLDPIAMPMKFMQEQMKEILGAIQQFKMFSDPAPHIVCGLSNVANGTKHKELINRTFLAMCMAQGLDAAICDVMDRDLVAAAKTADLVMNHAIYADSYV
jgi:5-methyltetrahydrofolate corrinoid/iron sulfur protein methyltransferase